MEKEALGNLKNDWNAKISRLSGLVQFLAGVFLAQLYQTVNNGDGDQAWPGWLFLIASSFSIWILIDMGGVLKRAVNVFIDIRLHQVEQNNAGEHTSIRANRPRNKENIQDLNRSDENIPTLNKNVKKYSAEYWRRYLVEKLRYPDHTSLEDALLRYSEEVATSLYCSVSAMHQHQQ